MTERIDSLFDLLLLKKEAADVDGLLATVEARLAALKASKVNVNLNAGGAVAQTKAAQDALISFTNTVNQFTQAVQQQSQATTQANTSTKTQTATTKTASAATAEQKEKLRQANAELKAQAKEALAAEGSLNKLRAQLVNLNNTKNNLPIQSKEYQQLVKDIKALNDQISIEEQKVGDFRRNVGNYANSFKSVIGDSIGSISQTLLAGVGITTGLAGIVDLFGSATQEAVQAEKASSRLKNTLDNLGRSDVFDDLAKPANALAIQFDYLDNDDLTEVFQQLITYGKLTEKQMKDLLPVIIDFSAKSGLSVNEGASVIIKALEGNAKALKEYGINVKDGSDVTERLGIIMTQLKPKVEGAAEAFKETFAGSVAVTRQEIANIKEDIGFKLLPVLKGFYAGLREAISGIGIIFNNVKGYINDTVENVKVAGGILKDVLTLNTTGALARFATAKAERDVTKKRIEDEKTLVEIQRQVGLVVSDASSKTVAQQKQILKGEEALLQASLARYNAAKKGTAEGRAAALDLIRSTDTVMGLRKQIVASQDTRVLGLGASDDGKDKKDKKKAVPKDYYLDFLKAEAEANKTILEGQADLYHSIYDTERESYLVRLDALKSYQATEIKLMEQERDDALKLNKEKTENELSHRDLTTKQRADITTAGNEQALAIEAKYLNQLQKVRLQFAKEQEDLQLKEAKRLLDTAQKTLIEQQRIEIAEREKGISASVAFQEDIANIRLNQITINANDEQKVLTESFTAGKISREKYEREMLAIQKKYALEALKVQLEVAENQLSIMDAGTKAYQDLQGKISKIKLEIAQGQQSSNEDTKKQLAKDIEEIVQISSAVASAIQGVIDAQYEAQQNAIKEQMDLVDIQKEKELKANEQLAQSAADKANNITAINARAAAKQEALRRQQNEIENRRAKADRAFQIFNIIGNTAVAVTKFLAEGNVIGAVIAGIQGAAQLAIVASSPIPKYRTGKNVDSMDKYEGISYVGDGGKSEMIIRENGAVEVTPNTPTLTYLKANDIVLPDAEAAMRAYNIAAVNTSLKSAGRPINEAQFDRAYIGALQAEIGTLKGEIRSVVNAVNNKPVAKVINTMSGLVYSQEEITGYREWVNKYFKS